MTFGSMDTILPTTNDLRIGIFGGTFDPPHKGHIRLAREAKKHLLLDRVLFIPTCESYMKEGVSSPEIRLKLAKLAVMGYQGFSVSDMEIRRGGKSYTCVTVEELNRTSPADYFFICGADTLFGMERWEKPEVIFAGVKIAVSVRDDADRKRVLKKAEELKKRFRAEVYLLPITEYDCSSSDIRARIGQGLDVSAQLPKRVHQYITEKGLYR